MALVISFRSVVHCAATFTWLVGTHSWHAQSSVFISTSSNLSATALWKVKPLLAKYTPVPRLRASSLCHKSFMFALLNSAQTAPHVDSVLKQWVFLHLFSSSQNTAEHRYGIWACCFLNFFSFSFFPSPRQRSKLQHHFLSSRAKFKVLDSIVSVKLYQITDLWKK